MNKMKSYNCYYNSDENGKSDKDVLRIVKSTVDEMIESLAKDTGFHAELCNLTNARKSTMGHLHSLPGIRGLEFTIRIMTQGIMSKGPLVRIDLTYEPNNEGYKQGCNPVEKAIDISSITVNVDFAERHK